MRHLKPFHSQRQPTPEDSIMPVKTAARSSPFRPHRRSAQIEIGVVELPTCRPRGC
ncbi:hypothetical protein HMPREF0762_00207 [Slackia exigua ATCC 700122]|uniref:Uncharacterized protein n=1 Tax=Slackia exigua (strain ATCC 700122 / DSM 15923 / CIP 105133 / JCM 11022 / KCTC 5966 / S-7) TaxID=649764 RepID=D0WEH7_SLAES|nr:hypothetical protein HMPREF0762_00207 [Slackia exigua ATCC 700122]